MPLILNRDLPVYQMLLSENPKMLYDENLPQPEQVHDIVILNLMSDKIDTELQFLRCLGAVRQFIRVDFMRQVSYRSANQDEKYLQRFYLSLEEVRNRHYDAMIITGAPLEHIPNEETLFWDEFCRILDWSRTNVHSVMYTCWGSFGGVHYDFGISKTNLYKKYSGVYNLKIHHLDEPLFYGCGSDLCMPISRATDMDIDAVTKNPNLILLASALNGTPVCLKTVDSRRFYITGHPEYGRDRLAFEYERDRAKKYAWEVPFPSNYFPNDDPTQTPTDRWIEFSKKIFCNWMDFYVDKTTAINR